jgi:hypothetical protein
LIEEAIKELEEISARIDIIVAELKNQGGPAIKRIANTISNYPMEGEDGMDINSDNEREYKVSPKPCRTCKGRVTWDLFPEIKYPIHVDEKAHKIGDGSCPKYGGGGG